MIYTKISLFGPKKSKGTFDDFFSTEKYKSLEEAYAANDYVTCDFVKDEAGIIHIECKHVRVPDQKKYHELNYQHCPAGLDALDDSLACEMAGSMLNIYDTERATELQKPVEDLVLNVDDVINRQLLSPSEALYGFGAWLTTRKGTLMIGETHSASIMAELVNEFCIANNLIPPRDKWHKLLNHPTTNTESKPVIEDASKIVIDGIRNDEGIRIAWQANIAMTMLDVLLPELEKHGYTQHSLSLLTNKGADAFLNLLTMEREEDKPKRVSDTGQ